MRRCQADQASNDKSSCIAYMRRIISLLHSRNRSFCQSVLFRSQNSSMSALENLQFDNLALRRLPIDSEERNYVRSVSGACFSKVKPTPVVKPNLVAYSEQAMALLDLLPEELNRKDFAEYFSGNKLLPGSDPAAHCYCGHQFGYFSGQLGDGAAMYLGEVINKEGERWEIQLKGAGLTPYSRSADGRKVLRSSIREFLCSEAINFLGIPTTRAGSCITSDSKVVRDVFYDGNPINEKCTVVLRIAPTFIRFGSFEIFKPLDPSTRRTGPSIGRTDIMKQLLDYTIETFYPQIHAASHKSDEAKYAVFFKEVVLRTAQLVAKWQCVGFCHGVLNTDNMSILGLTIDYGPFGFMDMYNPDFICNSSDDGGRYSYRRQPEMCYWNLQKLAEALAKLLPLTVSSPLLSLFDAEFKTCYLSEMRRKLGLLRKELPTDEDLIESLFSTMENSGADFTNTFRCLSSLDVPGLETHSSSLELVKQKLLDQCYPLSALAKSLKDGMSSRNLQMLLMLSSANPEFAARLDSSGMNLRRAIDKMEKVEKLENMSEEEKRNQDDILWTDWLNLYVKRVKSETESSSDKDFLIQLQDERVRIMNSCNPRFILRNYIAQDAITKAEKGDYREVQRVLKLLEKPYEDLQEIDDVNHGASSSKAVDDCQQGVSQLSCKSFVDQLNNIERLPPETSLGLRVT